MGWSIYFTLYAIQTARVSSRTPCKGTAVSQRRAAAGSLDSLVYLVKQPLAESGFSEPGARLQQHPGGYGRPGATLLWQNQRKMPGG